MNKNTYTVFGEKSLPDRASTYGRSKIFRKLNSTLPIQALDSILDVGVTADRTQDASNYFEKLYPFPNRITALSDQDASWLEQEYSGLKFVQGDALDMPFEDNTFDLVFSHAVIEHVGCFENQKKFLQECLRVSRRFVFITTPNRWYPVEFHTVLPLLHWLPKNSYRKILKLIGKRFFADEKNLNLLDKKHLLMLSSHPEYTQIHTVKFLGFNSNLLLTLHKPKINDTEVKSV